MGIGITVLVLLFFIWATGPHWPDDDDDFPDGYA